MDGPSIEELWRHESPLHDAWVLIEREVAAMTMDRPFIITIEAWLEDEQDGDASIDDLQVSNNDNNIIIIIYSNSRKEVSLYILLYVYFMQRSIG